MNEKPIQILISPLNWGLGHATRIVPLVYELHAAGCQVTIAAWGLPLRFLKNEFGQRVSFIEFTAKNIVYGKGGSLVGVLIKQLPSLIVQYARERWFVRNFIKMNATDIIISDNRYGFFHPKTISIFICHQLHLKMPRGARRIEGFINNFHRILIRRFDACLVPDTPQYPGLSGSLGHGADIPNLIYTGPMSRFQSYGGHIPDKPIGELPEKFILVLLSGPEPQRTLLENKLLHELQHQVCIIFRGIPNQNGFAKSGNHWVFNHANTPLLAWCIWKSELVISRSGYSTLMDLSVFGKKAVLIPTPGQTEQEYLAGLYAENSWCVSISQHQLTEISEALGKALKLKGIPEISDFSELAGVVRNIITEARDANRNKLTQ